jgi:ATP adenylyltransferase
MMGAAPPLRLTPSMKRRIMERLWSPWRMPYLLKSEYSPDCVFCSKLAADDVHDRDNLIIYRGQAAAIFINLFPYNNGHLMVIPYAHVPTTEALPLETLTEMMQLLNVGIAVLRKVVLPHGINVGINMGKPAGAGIHEHVHLHIVPRWEGDTNFLQVCAQTRVIPEMLPETYDKLVAALNEYFAEQKG